LIPEAFGLSVTPQKGGAEFSPGIIPGYFKSLSATNQIYISEREKIYEKQ